MRIEKVFVEFCGCPTTDKKVGLRKSSIEKFESNFPEIEVIEFVAKWKYDELQSKLAIAVETLEFYGNPESWIERDLKNELVRYNIIHDTELIEKYQHPQTDWIGSVVVLGRKARQLLEKWRKERKP